MHRHRQAAELVRLVGEALARAYDDASGRLSVTPEYLHLIAEYLNSITREAVAGTDERIADAQEAVRQAARRNDLLWGFIQADPDRLRIFQDSHPEMPPEPRQQP